MKRRQMNDVFIPETIKKQFSVGGDYLDKHEGYSLQLP